MERAGFILWRAPYDNVTSDYILLLFPAFLPISE